MTPNELDLRATLQQDANHIDATGDFATAAIGLERRRARRRTTLGTVAAVATLAVTAPLVWSNLGTDTTPAPATSPSVVPPAPSVSSPAPDTSAPPPTAARATPENTYALDDTIVANGRVIKLQSGTKVVNLAVLSNGGFVLGSELGDNPTEIEILSPEGKVVKQVSKEGGSYTVSRDGRNVLAQTRFNGDVVVYSSDGTELARRTTGGAPVALVGELAYLGGVEAKGTTEWNFVSGKTRSLPANISAVSDDGTRAAMQWPMPGGEGYDGCWAVADLTKAGFPKLIEKCGPKDNPEIFQPGSFSPSGDYLIGNKYVDGGDWFIPGVFRTSDGADVLGPSVRQPISGWTWRMADDEGSIVISRNTSEKLVGGVTSNTLQRCSLTMECTELAPEQAVKPGVIVVPRYVVPD